jgi:polyhydroxyalkanoate synthesis regulator phasin
MDEERREPRDAADGLRDGMRAVVGVLGAFKEAIEQTFEELKQQGELSPERAKRAAQSTMRRAQETVDEVRDRLDFVSRREFDELRADMERMRAEIQELRGGGSGSQAPEGSKEGPMDSSATHAADGPDTPRFTIDEG